MHKVDCKVFINFSYHHYYNYYFIQEKGHISGDLIQSDLED